MSSFGANSYVIAMVLVFLAIFLLVEGLYLFWNAHRGPDARKLQERLHALSASRDNTVQAQLLKERMLSDLPGLERAFLAMPRLQRLDAYIQQSGLHWSVAKLLLTSLALGLVGWMLVWSFAHLGVVASAAATAVLAAIPWFVLQRARAKRMTKMELQLPDALDLMTRALRSGHAFSSALKMVGEELPDPLAAEFRTVHDEINFGVSMQQALTNFSERVPLTDLRYFVVAVLIQRESGGNLTEILMNLSRLIRERLKLLSKVRVLSAEGRLSAWILGVMPFALAGVMNAFNPKFMSPLWTDPIGITIVKYMLILMAIGVIILRKIVRIRV
jgi:tight adherence protein B